MIVPIKNTHGKLLRWKSQRAWSNWKQTLLIHPDKNHTSRKCHFPIARQHRWTGQTDLLDPGLLKTSFNPNKQWSSAHLVPAPFGDLCYLSLRVRHLCCNEHFVLSWAIALFRTDEIWLQHRLRKKDFARLSPLPNKIRHNLCSKMGNYSQIKQQIAKNTPSSSL